MQKKMRTKKYFVLTYKLYIIHSKLCYFVGYRNNHNILVISKYRREVWDEVGGEKDMKR